MDGADGRTDWLTLEGHPATNLHLPFLQAFVQSTGPGTRRRSSLMARSCRWAYGEFLRFFAERLGEAVRVEEISAEDIHAYRATVWKRSNAAPRIQELRALTGALFELGLCDRSLFEAASVHVGKATTTPQVGFSPEVFEQIIAAASREAKTIIARIETGEALLASYRKDPESLTTPERTLGAVLDFTARTGKPPAGGRTKYGQTPATVAAKMLFLTIADLTPLMILLAARTGRNLETLKELTAIHQVRDGKILETKTVKRRRGYESESVSWEIGGPTRRMKTPGGMYILLYELCRRSRELSGSDALLCVYIHRGGGLHRYVWEERINNVGGPDLPAWAEKHGLTEDGLPLHLTFGRIKTTVDRDRAQKNDFQLDRAAVTNTPAVLYRSYIAPDPTARRALESITNAALLDLDARLTTDASPEKLVPISQRPAITEEPDAVTTAFMQCRNVLGHPEQLGVECTATFLDCFGCPCAVVSDENLPTIMRLSEELVERFERMPFDTWVQRYGQAWLAIQNDILPSRTPEELAKFAAARPKSTALALIEEPEMF